MISTNYSTQSFGMAMVVPQEMKNSIKNLSARVRTPLQEKMKTAHEVTEQNNTDFVAEELNADHEKMAFANVVEIGGRVYDKAGRLPNGLGATTSTGSYIPNVLEASKKVAETSEKIKKLDKELDAYPTEIPKKIDQNA